MYVWLAPLIGVGPYPSKILDRSPILLGKIIRTVLFEQNKVFHSCIRIFFLKKDLRLERLE